MSKILLFPGLSVDSAACLLGPFNESHGVFCLSTPWPATADVPGWQQCLTSFHWFCLSPILCRKFCRQC